MSEQQLLRDILNILAKGFYFILEEGVRSMALAVVFFECWRKSDIKCDCSSFHSVFALVGLCANIERLLNAIQDLEPLTFDTFSDFFFY